MAPTNVTLSVSPPLYSLKEVQQAYAGRVVLNIAELAIRPGEILALVGPSGAGKSTLLRLLAFLEQPSNGILSYNGQPISNEWPDLTTHRQVTMVFQRPQLLRRSVVENVLYGLKIRGEGGEPGRVEPILSQLGLSHLAQASAHTLSGGENQRVALARALVLRPRVLLLDEPTANLDPYNINLIEKIVRQANEEQGTTIIIVTHNIFQARRLAHRVGLLLDGKLVEVADTETFFETPQHPQTSAFVKGEIVY